MNSKLATRPRMVARLNVLLPEDEKEALFSAAAKRRLNASDLVRRGIELATREANDDREAA
jgi:hypothetical protein